MDDELLKMAALAAKAVAELAAELHNMDVHCDEVQVSIEAHRLLLQIAKHVHEYQGDRLMILSPCGPLKVVSVLDLERGQIRVCNTHDKRALAGAFEWPAPAVVEATLPPEAVN